MVLLGGWVFLVSEVPLYLKGGGQGRALDVYRGTSIIKNSHPPQDHHRTQGIVLLWGPGRGLLLVSEVPL